MGNVTGSPAPRPQLVVQDRLDSWKEIAAYLRRGERTVQRWEREQGLPVHRLVHNRQGSVYAYKSELDHWWNSRRTQIERRDAVASPEPSRLRRWFLAAAAMALAAAVGIAFWVHRADSIPPPAGQVRPLTSYPGNEACPSLSPDGQRVAFAWDGHNPGSLDIYVQPVDSGSPLRLTSSRAWDVSPAFSPDGRSIAFLRLGPWGKNDGLYIVPAIGGPERRIAEVLIHYSVSMFPLPMLAWTPDGAHIAVGAQHTDQGRAGIVLVEVKSGRMRSLVAPEASPAQDVSPSFAPDGSRLAFARCRGHGPCDLYVAGLSPSYTLKDKPRQISFGEWDVISPVWAANGREILFASGAPWENRRLARIALSNGRKAVAESYGGSEVLAISTAPQAGLLAFSRETFDGDMWMIELDRPGAEAGAPKKIAPSTRLEHSPDLSPDGGRIAFTSSRSGVPEIWVAGRDGSHPIQLTRSGDRRSSQPRWSPDGQLLVYVQSGEGASRICVVRAAGGASDCLTGGKHLDSAPSWSRDGRSIYFLSRRSGSMQVWKMPAGGESAGAPVQITTAGATGQAFESGDGKTVYYTGPEGGVWRVPASGGRESPVAGLPGYGAAYPCRRGIYFLAWSEIGRPASLLYLDFGSHVPVTVATVEEPYGAIAAAEDGRTVLFAKVERREGDLFLVENFR